MLWIQMMIISPGHADKVLAKVGTSWKCLKRICQFCRPIDHLVVQIFLNIPDILAPPNNASQISFLKHPLWLNLPPAPCCLPSCNLGGAPHKPSASSSALHSTAFGRPILASLPARANCIIKPGPASCRGDKRQNWFAGNVDAMRFNLLLRCNATVTHGQCRVHVLKVMPDPAWGAPSMLERKMCTKGSPQVLRSIKDQASQHDTQTIRKTQALHWIQEE